MKNNGIDIIKSLNENRTKRGLEIDRNNFILPEMWDFYTDNMTASMLEKVDSKLIEGEKTNEKDALFYIENPYTEKLGYNENAYIFVLKGKPNLDGDNDEYNKFDGDTIQFSLDKIADGDSSFTIGDVNYKNFHEYILKNIGEDEIDKKQFSLRFVGINAPEITHYRKIPKTNKDEIITMKYSKFKEFTPNAVSNYIYEHALKRDDNSFLRFLKTDSSFFEIKNETDDSYKVVVLDSIPEGNMEYKEQGLQAKETVKNMISKASDIRIVIDAKTINKSAPIVINTDDFTEQVKKILKELYTGRPYDYSGYNGFGQELHKRFLGAVYIKTDIEGYGSVWINLAKYLIAKFNQVAANVDYTNDPKNSQHYSFVSDAFKLWTYDNKSGKIIDSIEEISKGDFDDRRKIQKTIMNADFDSELRDFYVMIGDCLFLVPPTSIRTVTQTDYEKIPLMRSKGSLLKNRPRSERLIEMTLYFNNDEGINGFPYESELYCLDPNTKRKSKIVYYMNGLRSMISQFKFTPFLPIENTYINDTLGIEAVSLLNFQISTMPNFPRCLAATLTLEEFNYRIYMPEIIPPIDETGEFKKNLFASTISFETMRWYYQRAIKNGDSIKDLEFNSPGYISATFGSKTALQPMNFKNPYLDFYILDKDYLDQQLQLKINALNAPLMTQLPLNKDGINLGKAFAKVYYQFEGATTSDRYNTIAYVENSDNFKKSVKDIKDYLKSNLKGIVTDVTYDVKETFDKNYDLSGTYNVRGAIIIDFKISINMDVCQDGKQAQILLDTIAKDITNSNGGQVKADDILKNNQLIITFCSDQKDYPTKLIPDKNSLGYKFLIKCTQFGGATDSNYEDIANDSNYHDSITNDNMQNYLMNRKENTLDFENFNSLKFVKYPIGNVLIQNIACSFGNTFTKIGLQAFDGYAPQYLGGQDTVIELTLQTKDETAVKLINNLPKLSAEYTRDYRLILNCWPLRLDSELTRLLGVNEVVIETCEVLTVQGQPGLFNIQVRLIAVDRTLRNRESLKKIDDVNNSGSIATSNKNTITTRNFFNLKDALSRAEIYPDLELPTIDELSAYGFKFIRYSNTKGRIYPDPDFYFVFGHIACYEYFRNSILDSFNEEFKKKYGDDGTIKMHDTLGASVSLNIIKPKDCKDPEASPVYTLKDDNETFKLQKEKMNKYKETLDKLYTEQQKNARKINMFGITQDDKISALMSAEIYEGWNIADNIRCVFREQKFESAFNNNTKVRDEIEKRNKTATLLIDNVLSKPINTIDSSLKGVNWKVPLTDIESSIRDTVEKFFKDDIGSKILDEICISPDVKSKTIKNLVKVFCAAAAARSGEHEFDTSDKWKPIMKINETIPLCIIKDNNGKNFASSYDEALLKGIEFGMYKIKKYEKKEVETITGQQVTGNGDNGLYFLDPYYGGEKATTDDVNNYKIRILSDAGFSTMAFIRIVLMYMKRLIEENIYISLLDLIIDGVINSTPTQNKGVIKDSDPLANAFANAKYNTIINVDHDENKKQTKEEKTDDEKAKKEVDANTITSENVLDVLVETLIKEKAPMALGKLIAPIVLAVTDGDITLFNYMLNREYNALNILTSNAAVPTGPYSDADENVRKFRKFILAMAGYKLYNRERIADRGKYVGDEINNIINERVYLIEAEDPTIYMLHSFYDMIANDKRGRMLRAFPTFYMLFIDEGREIGLWKMHDNFYNTNSIAELQITKSRKIAADTAHITMTNIFKTFTTDDEDIKIQNDYHISDVFDSIFSPRKYFLKEEAIRQAANTVQKTQLKPGVRLHIRIGYGADASKLPIVFNGCIAEVSAGEAVEIVAQGDGIELSNPLLSEYDAEDIKNEEDFIIPRFFKNWATKGATPRTILASLLTTKGGWTKKKIFELTSGRFFNDNPFGIIHFGEPEYKQFFENGEVVQNIYEAQDLPSWGDTSKTGSIYEEYGLKDIPKFSTQIFGKSYWDIMNMCRAVSPDFVCSVIPFGLRSSIFYGAPRYYCAYDYEQIVDKKTNVTQIKEARKPFEQYHIYTSYSDIIGNSIKASDKEVRTCAIGLYDYKGKVERVGPLFVDFDIYPEKQKTITVDTQYKAKGTLTGFFSFGIYDWYKSKVHGSDNSLEGGYQIAWRMTASALKDSIADMYQGEIITIGDPSVKPYDRTFIIDNYERMQGQCKVEAVVHNLSVENGFTTSIFTDCISTVDDRHEHVVGNIFNKVTTKAFMLYGSNVALSSYFASKTKPYIPTIFNYVGKGTKYADSLVKQIAKLFGKDEWAASINLLDSGADILESAGLINKEGMKYASGIDEFKRLKNLLNLKTLSGGTNLKGIISNYEKIVDFADKANIESKIKNLEEIRKNKNLPKKELDAINDALLELKYMQKDYNATVEKLLSELKKISGSGEIEKLLTDSAEDKKLLEVLKANKNITNLDEAKEYLKALNKVSVPNTKEGIDVIKKLEGLTNDTVKVIKDDKLGTSFIDLVTKNPEVLKIDKFVTKVATTVPLKIIGGVIEIAGWEVISKMLYEYIERQLKNLQVLQIFPLRKDGKVYTAGLDGSKGLIIGSPTYNDPGIIQGTLINLTKDKPDHPVLNFLKNMFVSDNFKEIINSWTISPENSGLDTAVGKEDFLNNMIGNLAHDEVQRMDKYNAMIMIPRIKNLADDKKATASSFQTYSIADATKITENSNVLDNMIPIIDNSNLIEDLKNDKGESYFQSIFTKNPKIENMTFKINGSSKTIPCIKNADGTIDMPFLRPDSYFLLLKILDSLKKEFEPDSSYHSTKSGFTTHPVILQSALIAGDKNHWDSTGFVFTLQVVDYDLNKILKNLYDEQQSILKSLGKSKDVVFDYKAINKDTYKVFVHPPKNN